MAIDVSKLIHYSIACTVCQKELSPDETYICQSCNDEIDRRANETMGNQESVDGEPTQ